jgi:hypothetical protein
MYEAEESDNETVEMLLLTLAQFTNGHWANVYQWGKAGSLTRELITSCKDFVVSLRMMTCSTPVDGLCRGN